MADPSPENHRVAVDIARDDDLDQEDQEDAGVGALQRDLERAEEEFQQINDNNDQARTDATAQERRTPQRQPRSNVRVSSVSSTSQTASFEISADADLYGAESSLAFESVVEGGGKDLGTKRTNHKHDRRRYLRHQATSLTGATKIDWYDEDLLHRAVADAGRWAYGTIFVEVWLLSQDKLTLVRPHQGWWIDPVHHNQFHSKTTPKNSLGDNKPKTGPRAFLQKLSSSVNFKITDKEKQQQEDQDLTCPICRLTVENRPDYLEPAPMVPGEGLPGVLWQDDHNPHFLADRNSTRGGSQRGSFGAAFFAGSNRGGGGTGGGGGGTGTAGDHNRGSHRATGFLFPHMQKMYQEGQSAGMSEDSASPGAKSERPSQSPNATRMGPTRPLGKKATSDPDGQSTPPTKPAAIHAGGQSDPVPSSSPQQQTPSPSPKRDPRGDILLSVPAAPEGTAHSDRSLRRGIRLGGGRDGGDGGANPRLHRHQHHHQPKVVWRNIRDLANDPDSPWNPRLQHMAFIGLGWAAAVPIRHEGEKQGIVIYMARAGVDLGRLKHPTNEAYLVAASNLISAALIIRTPRHDAMKDRKQESSDTVKRIRKRILEARAAGIPLDELVRQNEEKKRKQHGEAHEHGVADEPTAPDEFDTWLRYQWDRFACFVIAQSKRLWVKLLTTLRKSLALSNVKPPPAATWRQSMLNFVGVFIMLLTLTNINSALTKAYGPRAALVLGPFGALATLLFGLSAAPASQPRNAVLGQTFCISLARILRYIPMSFWSNETRVSVTVALAVSGMTKFGWTHPPAGAAALLWSINDTYDWSNMGVLLMGDVTSIIIASLINNWSAKRQYPSSWGFWYGYERLENLLTKKKV